jgi:phage tail-like protein
LKYLPPVLWEHEPAPPEFSLGAALRIFEKILTGISDDVTVEHAGHVHPPINTEVARLVRVFDPWKTPEEFLPWLASWVALEFPTLQGAWLWDEYQQRKATSQIATIYRQRGLKAGLNQYLELYAVGTTKPRVALDDGSRVLTLTPGQGAIAPVSALVAPGPVVSRNTVWAEGVTRPSAVAVAPDGSLFLADQGVPSGNAVTLPRRVWRLDSAGHQDLTAIPLAPAPPAPQKPQPIAPTQLANMSFAAVAVAPPRGARPEALYVLNTDGVLFAVRTPYRDVAATQVTSLAAAGVAITPVAMAVDSRGDLVVLDRGGGPGTPSAPKVITVKLDPLSVTRTNLTTVVEPLSVLAETDGSLLIGDGRAQEPADVSQFPGNLVRVDRSATPWTEKPLLPAANPLVAPTGLARTADGRLYALDLGLKPVIPSTTDPFIGAVAEQAAVFRIDLASSPPTAHRITQPGQFVNPTGMAAAGRRLVICDPGHMLQPIWARVRPFQFDVVIHFADSNLPTDPVQRSSALAKAVGDIGTIVDLQKPAHTVWTLVTRI